MKELRDIKIDLLMGNQNPIIDLFNQITEGIDIICCDVYEKHGQEFIYFTNAKTAEQYHKDGEWIFYQDCKNEKFWCNYRKYWTLFESNFHLNYVEIQSITKVLVEDALKREVGTTIANGFGFTTMVEDALKREVGTTYIQERIGLNGVEEALKREVSTPMPFKQRSALMLEDALKREVKQS
jgi:hypothetical protein